MDNSASPKGTRVTLYDIEGGEIVTSASLTFFGDCLTPSRTCAEEWLQAEGYVSLNVAGTAWEQLGIGSMQATLEEES